VSDYSDSVRAVEAERDRLTIVLDEVYEQRDHYRRSLALIHEAFPDNVELREMTARALGHTFPSQMRNV
jgi:hypothetical protein